MKSIIDTAAVSCAFSLPSGTSTNGEVVLVGNATCANAASNNQNNCIECNTSASGNTCSVSCSGWIPSRADVAADSMTIRLVLTSTLTTDMPDVTVGGIQFVGDTSLWTAFDPQVTLATDTAGCNGNPSTTEMTLGTLHASSSTAADGWNHRYPISAGGSQSNHCTVGHQIDGIISFSGADTGGTTISSAGTVTMIAKICDLAASCGM